MEFIQYPSIVIVYILLLLVSLLFGFNPAHNIIYGIALAFFVFVLVILGLYFGISYLEFLFLFLPLLLLNLAISLRNNRGGGT